MSKQNDPDRLLTTRDAADILKLSIAWFESKRCKGGGPPYVKIGHAVRYRQGDIYKFIEDGRRSPNAMGK